MSQILGVKFSDHGPVCYFASGLNVLRVGQCVLVETDQGLALGRVVTVSAPDLPGTMSEETGCEAPAEGAPAPFELTLGVVEWRAGDTPAVSEPTEAADASASLSQSGPADAENAAAPETQHAPLFLSEQAAAQPVPHSLDGLPPIHRLATDEDLSIHEENRSLASRAFSYCRGCIGEQKLDMKLVDVEVLHDRSKLIFFFTAPNRIDFRELIKSLVREFHTRIELRQIGVRHETQMIGAIGNCGQVCCCRRFLRKFAPVTIKMAKEQNLFLNPAKISGICGRLLCCLSYEQKGYEEFHKQCPKIGKRVQTPLGNVKVLRANFFKKSISVWIEDEGEREFTLEEWKEMLNSEPGEAVPPPPRETAPVRPGRTRVSAGRPSRSERQPRADHAEKEQGGERSAEERPSRPERPPRVQPQAEPEVAPAAAPPADGPRVEPGEGEPRERHRPRRKRRKSKGPRPE